MSTEAVPAAKPSLLLNIALWIVQVLLAAMFLMAGGSKVAMNYADMVKMATEAHGLVIPEPLLRFIGVSEVAGALGMLLPAATRIMPILTAWAAVGLGTIMVLATTLHLTRGEWSNAGTTGVLLVMAVFVAWGRFKAAPIQPRG
jgi:uncharacterized membrane protein YphA (DoxX/SURF4 family)